ncbi:MAG: hypothetical protein JXR90_01265 [Spirochaetes bacterium]|nr:hypothetical protein [Spirochaetota bacterium]
MKTADICIMTRCGSDYGSGHFWRMTNLLSILRNQGLNVYISCDCYPDNFPDNLRPYTSHSPVKAEILIRDMRDSTKDAASLLAAKYRRIISIDDAGYTSLYNKNIDLLPRAEHPIETGYGNFPFVFGYHFSKAINDLHSTPEKDLDLLIYTGFGNNDYPLLSENQSLEIAFFNGSNCYYKGSTLSGSSYYNLLFKSKNFLSHFGLSLYEAYICNCNIFALNPSDYHSKLTDNEKRIPVINLGTFANINKELQSTLKKTILEKTALSMFNLEETKNRINEMQSLFVKLLEIAAN